MNELKRLLVMLDQANEIWQNIPMPDQFEAGALYANDATKKMIQKLIDELEASK